jgi:hydrogenase nickel incorporation protein HypA/HybF
VHELSVCRALLDEVMRVAVQRDAQRVSVVRLQVGPLSGVVSALLVHAYPMIAAGTRAEGAELVIDETPIRVRCTACGMETEVQTVRLLCGACASPRVALIGGDELLLESVELQFAGDSTDSEESGHV